MSPQFLVLARAVDDLAGGDLLEVPAVDRLAVGLRGLLQIGCRDPAVLPGDLLGHGHGQVLGVLDGADELRGLVQALHGAGVQPRVAAAQGDDGQRPSSRYIWLSVVISSSPRAEGLTSCALAATSPG